MYRLLLLLVLFSASVHALPMAVEEPELADVVAPIEGFSHNTAIFTPTQVISIPSQMAQMMFGKSPASGIRINYDLLPGTIEIINIVMFSDGLPTTGDYASLAVQTPEAGTAVLTTLGLLALGRGRSKKTTSS